MKMFKKLMAVALAGVMAMAVLTGCGSSLNEKEVIAVINDALKAPLADFVEGETGEKDTEITFKAADSELKDKTKAVAGIVEEKIGEKETMAATFTLIPSCRTRPRRMLFLMLWLARIARILICTL